MTGWRLGIGRVVHLFEECVPFRNGRAVPMEKVILAKRADGTVVRYDPLLNHAMTVKVCARCESRRAAANP